MALNGACACASLGVPHFEGGIPLPAPSHNGLAIWGEAPAAHRPRVTIQHLHLYTQFADDRPTREGKLKDCKNQTYEVLRVRPDQLLGFTDAHGALVQRQQQ